MRKAIVAIPVLAVLVLTACGPDVPEAAPEVSPAATAGSTRVSGEHAGAYELADRVDQKGWDVKVDERDGGIAFEGTEDQMDQYQCDMEECMSRHDDGTDLKDFTAEQWDEYCEAESERAECLREQGVNVPRMPSRQAFIDSFGTSEPWIAYSFVGEVSEDEWCRLNRACPQ